MRVPDSLVPLVDQGVIDNVVRPLMSGKEAQVYLVEAHGELRVAKVYKEAQNRSFKQRADYTEGRRTRSSRNQRAMDKRSKYGRAQAEAAWRTTEVDAIYKLTRAGVRVPHPYDFVEGVLVMELISDETGAPAPRLVDVTLDPDQAQEVFDILIREVVKMLCAGVVHGDLSDFNVLMSPKGPVIIDFPQVVDPAFNRNARRLLVRDVKNITQFLGRYKRRLLKTRYGQEMWGLYEKGNLEPDTRLTGKWRAPTKKADTYALLRELEELERESRERREALGLGPPRPARKPAPLALPKPDPPEAEGGSEPGSGKRRRRRRRRRGGGDGRQAQTGQGAAQGQQARRNEGHTDGGRRGGARGDGDRRDTRPRGGERRDNAPPEPGGQPTAPPLDRQHRPSPEEAPPSPPQAR